MSKYTAQIMTEDGNIEYEGKYHSALAAKVAARHMCENGENGCFYTAFVDGKPMIRFVREAGICKVMRPYIRKE